MAKISDHAIGIGPDGLIKFGQAGALEPFPAPVDPPDDVLDEARRLTSGDRNAQYGPPDQDFQRTAQMWGAYLGTDVKPSDVAWMMTMLKASRNRHQQKRDNYVDAIGYVRCGAMCDGFDPWRGEKKSEP